MKVTNPKADKQYLASVARLNELKSQLATAIEMDKTGPVAESQHAALSLTSAGGVAVAEPIDRTELRRDIDTLRSAVKLQERQCQEALADACATSCEEAEEDFAALSERYVRAVAELLNATNAIGRFKSGLHEAGVCSLHGPIAAIDTLTVVPNVSGLFKLPRPELVAKCARDYFPHVAAQFPALRKLAAKLQSETCKI